MPTVPWHASYPSMLWVLLSSSWKQNKCSKCGHIDVHHRQYMQLLNKKKNKKQSSPQWLMIRWSNPKPFDCVPRMCIAMQLCSPIQFNILKTRRMDGMYCIYCIYCIFVYLYISGFSFSKPGVPLHYLTRPPK